jgi:preprotein translocase subunit SecG
MDKKGNTLMILGVVAILAIVGMVLLFKSAMTGQGIYAQAGKDIYGPGTPVFSDNCVDLFGPG